MYSLLLATWLARAVRAESLGQAFLTFEGSGTVGEVSEYVTGVGMDLTSNYGYV